MGKSLKKYNIFHAKKIDSQEILEFIKAYWSDQHIFVKSKKFFLWQYCDAELLNFIIARNIQKGNIDAILGYIPTKKFDPNLIDNDNWGAIWKIKEGASPGLGMVLLNYLNNSKSNATYAAIGISDIAKRIYSHLGYKSGHLNHFFCTNLNNKKNQIIQIDRPSKHKKFENKSIFKKLNSLKKTSLIHRYNPTKSVRYLTERYHNHPIYKYLFYGVYKKQKIESIWVIRKQFLNSSSCLRIVDIYGSLENVGSLYNQFQNLMQKEKSEYIDCLNYGISESIFTEIGFEKLDTSKDIIIPNYFEPHVNKNINIGFAIKSSYENYVIFKGDSDQDRPNQI